MKSISRWLVPGFLRRLDQYLRERYPVLWYTGAHGVLFYGLLGGLVLFGAGLLSPVHRVKRELVDGKYKNLDQWLLKPVQPIEFAYDKVYISTLLLVIAFAGIWLYRQQQIRPFFYRMQHSLLCLLVYAGCWWVLGGATVAAFRMGTIVKTAWFWMPEQDLQVFKDSGVYPYGFTLLSKDSTGIIPADTLAFFKKRELIYKRIWEKEEIGLKSRYNIDPDYSKQRLVSQSFKFDMSTHSFQFYLSHKSYRSYLLNRSYLSFYPYRSYFLYVSYRSYQLRWFDGYDRLYRSLYEANPNSGVVLSKVIKYNLINSYDTLDVEKRFIIPSLPYQIEGLVHIVEHARQFLYEGIFWRYFGHWLYYLLLIAVVVFLLPWVSARNLLPLGIMVLLGWFGIQFFEINGWEGYKAIWQWVHCAAYLTVPLCGLLLLLGMLWQQKQGYWFVAAVNMVFLGVLIVLLGALNIVKNETFTQFGSPIDAAFYGAQVIGLLAACIVPYIQAMPKTR